MAGSPRPLLVVSIGAVLLMGAFAGIESGEHTLTLAIGGLLATLTGGAWMVLSNPANSTHRSLGLAQGGPFSRGESVETTADLPDPMDHDVDMPL